MKKLIQKIIEHFTSVECYDGEVITFLGIMVKVTFENYKYEEETNSATYNKHFQILEISFPNHPNVEKALKYEFA